MASTDHSLSPADFARKYRTALDLTPNMRALFIEHGSRYRWFAVFAIMAGSFSTLLAGTIINVAIPEVMGAYGMPQDEAQWLSAGFLAASTITMLLSAWALESFGMRSVFIFGMGSFMAGAVLGGIAPNTEMLILARLIQGAGSGFIGPLGMLVLFQVFPMNQRGRAMGLFGVGSVLAPALGPSVGGWLIDTLAWQYVFYSALPFCFAAIPIASVYLPPRESTGPRPGFDWIGFFLMMTFVPTLMLGLSNGTTEGWGSDWIVGLLMTAGLSITAFIIWESIAPEPMLDLRLFLNLGFATAAVVTFILGLGLYGSTYLVPLFLQTVHGQTATSSGLLMLPAGLTMALVFLIGGELSDRLPSHVLIISGLLTFALFSWLMSGVDANTPYMSLLWWAIIGRIGLGLIFPTLNRASLSSLPFELLSQGSGAVNFLRQLGGAFGVNLLAIMLEERREIYRDAFTIPQNEGSGAMNELLLEIGRLMAQAGLPEMAQMYSGFGFLERIIQAQAGMMAFRDGFLACAILFALCVIPAWFMNRTKPGEAE